jgi:ATP-dependent DNA helicase PIF1
MRLKNKQQIALKACAEGNNVFITGPGGVGKCMSFNTPVIMCDGSVKMIQDITEGEFVMGDDSTPRQVLGTTTGIDEMYRVSTTKRDTYTVNSQHILTFKITKNVRWKKEKNRFVLIWGDISGKVRSKDFKTEEDGWEYAETLPDIVDLQVTDCLKSCTSKYWREFFQGMYTGLDFREQVLEIEPYMLGLWLGDRTSSAPHVTNTDNEIIEYLREYCERHNLSLGKADITYKILDSLRNKNVFRNKHIPLVYKANSRENRLKLLAGLLDSDGSLINNCYEITQNNKLLADDIYFLSKSLGFQVSFLQCKKWCMYKGEKREGFYYRMHISGHTDEIPVLIARKKAAPRKQIKNNLVSEIGIECVGKEKYYGFELDGNHRFVLGNFLVTHNSAVVKAYTRAFGETRNVALTSSTGVSALLIGGTTLHSYTGIGLGRGRVDTITQQIFQRPYLRRRWEELETLVIDEISMISPALFDKLEEIARVVRNSTSPFGGIQLILSGDFLQLPAIDSNEFCFQAESWGRCIGVTVYLDEVIRQGDPVFQRCLNLVRIGEITEEVRDTLTPHIGRELINPYGIKPTRLYPLNKDVDVLNEQELDILAEDGRQFYEYNMDISVHKSVREKEVATEKFLKHSIAPQKIQLCIGAQVMLLYNMDLSAKLANGSRGVIVDFVGDMPVVRFLHGEERVIDYHVWEVEDNGSKIMRATQIPLRLAYAISIHRAQGASLDYAEIDLEGIFEYGQAYTALSRVKSLDGLSILKVDWSGIRANPDAVEYYSSLQKNENSL